MAINWSQTSAGRRNLSDLAREREVDRLAERANCSRDEGQEHRSRGERFCLHHGWYRQRLCMRCKAFREHNQRKLRQQQREE